MYLRIIGNEFSHNIFKEISLITDHSILLIDEVKYSEKKKSVDMIIDRCRLLRMDKKWLGLKLATKYDKKNRIRTRIVISKIDRFEIANEFSFIEKETILERGVYFKEPKKIYICSAAEENGKMLYYISVDVSEIDILIEDL